MQDQFLKILTREEADVAFRAALDPKPLGMENVPLAELSGRVLAQDIRAGIDIPPFDRSVVDGFAIRAGDTAMASETRPVALRLNGETIACGHAPRITVEAGTATMIATGAPVPRGADSVVMLENTVTEGGMLIVRRAHNPGQNISFAGSDIASGQGILFRGMRMSAREIAILAAIGRADALVWRKPRIAVFSTGDELVAPGEPLRAAGVYDSNGPVVVAALQEHGCIADFRGVIPDDMEKLGAAMRQAHAECDGVILSGGTSKGAGDLTYRLINGLGRPGIIAHGVALKPGKPLCLAVCDGKPVVALPGFPTSAMFTFHDLVAPVFRAMAGLPPDLAATVDAHVPVRLSSELGRREFVMVALGEKDGALVAHPVGKGSGAVTAFAQADGFFSIDALSDVQHAGTVARVTLFSRHVEPADITIIGSHCVGLDHIISRLYIKGIRARILAVGSLGGAAALARSECDLAPVHVLDPATGLYNQHLVVDGLRLLNGWRRMQGIVHRHDDILFAGTSIEEFLEQLELPGPQESRLMVNRNSGAGTRILIDRLLGGKRPAGYWNQPRSHNAVAAAIAQGRADWGVAIRPVADAQGLAFIPLAEEKFDFLLPVAPRRPEMITAFEEALRDSAPALLALGFTPG